MTAVADECSILCSNLKLVKRSPQHYSGSISGKRVILSVSGMGKVNAAQAATRLIFEYGPSMIINIGIGGAYPSSGLKAGDIAVAEEEIYADEGVLLDEGFRSTEFIGIPLVKRGSRKYFNRFSLDRRLRDKAIKAARKTADLIPRTAAKKGSFLTVSTCTGTMKRAAELEDRFGAICENMEGAAIAHVCTLYGLPLIEMRGISNIVEKRDISKWNVNLASENCQMALLELLKGI